jgi:uncharacterized membrane protein YphA (DoxX/SURF4 family)
MKKLFHYVFVLCLICVLWVLLEIFTPLSALVRIFVVAGPLALLAAWMVIACARDSAFRGVMNRTLLVVLRLAIGWLFLIEGLEKFESHRTGPTTTSKPWSAAGYLREANGPLSPFFHWQVGGDADEVALDRLKVRDLQPNEDPKATTFRQRVSPGLKKDWEDHVDRFVNHYGFDDEQRQKAQALVEQSLDSAGAWLLGLDKTRPLEVDRAGNFPGAPPYKKKGLPPEFIKEYRAKVAEYREVQDRLLPAFGKDVAHDKLRTLKAEAAVLRIELLNELQTPLEKGLQDLLTSEQKAMPPLEANPPATIPEPYQDHWKDVFGWNMRQWTDFIVRWGILIIGVALLLGVFTRLSCLGGAMFLIFLHLAMPAFPWLPENIKAEGHYIYVSKNLITALALLALATTSSGCWFGLDGLLQFLNPWRSRCAEPESRVERRLAETFPR